jgi:hypothetical protein
MKKQNEQIEQLRQQVSQLTLSERQATQQMAAIKKKNQEQSHEIEGLKTRKMLQELEEKKDSDT